MATKSDFIFKYRVRNWPAYNKALVQRGNLTFWLDEEAIRAWRDAGASGPRGGRPEHTPTPRSSPPSWSGRPSISAFGRPQGFLESVVRLMGVDLPVPDFTTVCKRQRDLQVQLGARPAEQPRHVVIDTTGLEVFGAGKWYVRKHGYIVTN